ncbi:MAG: ParB N-terminal domain-containing protein [Chloroflexi bacterium]|nr:ParB N-terminal domain-containing protein [Chloroflexota bacterium]MBU1750988.1 ParB N-terminal domain-containing protein [Chloroflexota bacterium]
MPKKSFRDTLQDRRLGTMPTRGTGPLRRESDLVVANLVFEPQPRWIVLPRVLQDLIAQGLNHPPAVLARLQELAGDDDDHSRQVLAGLETLAASIREHGVIDPIIFHYQDEGGPAVVDDGHRRSLAAHLAGRQTIPGVERAQLANRLDRHFVQLTTSLEREDLTAIELAYQLAALRDELVPALLAGGELGGPWSTESDEPAASSGPWSTESDEPAASSGPWSTESDEPAASSGPRPTEPDDLAELSGPWSTEPNDLPELGGPRPTAPTTRRTALAQARNIILARLPRLERDYYYRLLRLADRLAPVAREAALQARLTESQLRPVVDHIQDPDQQVACIQAIATHELIRRQADVLVQQVLAGADPFAVAARLVEALPRQPKPSSSAGVTMPTMHRTARPIWRRLYRTARALTWTDDPDLARQWQGLSRHDLAHIREQAQAVQAAAARVLDQTAPLLESAPEPAAE